MPFKTLTGLWQSEKGFLSGKSNEDVVIPAGVKFFVFENNKRKSDQHPTHRLAIAYDDESEQQQYGREANKPDYMRQDDEVPF